jgi:hypothetical protein
MRRDIASGTMADFQGLAVIADRLTRSDIQANANLSIARAHDDEENRMTFQSDTSNILAWF